MFLLSTTGLLADRRSGGSVKQSRNTNAGADRSNNYNRPANTNTEHEPEHQREPEHEREPERQREPEHQRQPQRERQQNNVNVNRNVNVNTGYGYPARGGAVAVGEEGAVAVGRRGAVAVGEEGYAGVGRYGAVVGGERYESYEGWKIAAGVATGIAIGTMLARPPSTSVTVVTGGTNYMYADGAYYEQVMYEGEVSYRVVNAPAGAIITTLPGGCTTTVMNGVTVSQCGSTYYQRVSNGYQVVVF